MPADGSAGKCAKGWAGAVTIEKPTNKLIEGRLLETAGRRFAGPVFRWETPFSEGESKCLTKQETLETRHRAAGRKLSACFPRPVSSGKAGICGIRSGSLCVADKISSICLAVILLSFLMQAITEQNYLCCACVSGVSALLCGSYDIQAERGSASLTGAI